MDALLLDGVLACAVAQVRRTRGTRLGAREPVVVGALRGLGDVALGERDLNRSKLEGMHEGEPGGEPSLSS
jgi:hypothetical protein